MITFLTNVTSIPTVAAVRRRSQQVLSLQTFSNILFKLCKIYITTVLQPQIIPPLYVLISCHECFLLEQPCKIFKKNNSCVKKGKWSRYRPDVAQRVGRGIALLFHDRGTRRGWVDSSTPRPQFTPGKDPVLIVQVAGWAPGPVWTGGKSRPHRESIPDHAARSSVAIPTELPGPQVLCTVA